jgi:hypothetical protein
MNIVYDDSSLDRADLTLKKDGSKPLNANFSDIEKIVGEDLKKISDIFNSYATRKTIATGFFNIALLGIIC